MNKKGYFEELLKLRSDFRLAQSMAYANKEWLDSGISEKMEKETNSIIEKAVLDLRISSAKFKSEFIFYLKTGEVNENF